MIWICLFYTFSENNVASSKKIFIIAPDGDLPKVLRKANQYVADYDVENIKKVLLRMKEDAVNRVEVKENQFKQFELEHLTELIEAYIR